MKYHKPNQGAYEANLTAKLMYNIVDGLIKRHVTREESEYIERVKRDFGGLENLWMKPEIRSKLEEFVHSYFFTDLKEPLPGFKEIFTEKDGTVGENLENYMNRLGQQCGRDEANREIARLFDELKKRYSKLVKEKDVIRYLKKGKRLIKNNAQDGFSNVSNIIYLKVQIGIDHFRTILPQS